MYGFFVRRDEKKVTVVGRWLLAEVDWIFVIYLYF